MSKKPLKSQILLSCNEIVEFCNRPINKPSLYSNNEFVPEYRTLVSVVPDGQYFMVFYYE